MRRPCVGAWTMAAVLALAGGCKKAPAPGAQAAARPAPRVVIAEVATKSITESITPIGNVQANEMIELKSEIDGVVEEILFEEGQRVQAGQLLVRLDESKLSATLAQTEANYKLSQANYERAKELFDGSLISKQDFDQASASFEGNRATVDLFRRQLRDTKIKAPFEGVVSSRSISPGQVISRNSIITWVMDLDPVKVEIQIPERFLSAVAVGQQVAVKVAAFPNKSFFGKVYFVSPFVDPVNRTALIKAEVPNPDHELRPGMFGSINLTLTVREGAVVIPEMALMQVQEGGRGLVMVVNEAMEASVRPVKIGTRLVGEVEVREGLKLGEKIIVEGLQKAIPGQKVQLAPPSAAKSPGDGMQPAH